MGATIQTVSDHSLLYFAGMTKAAKGVFKKSRIAARPLSSMLPAMTICSGLGLVSGKEQQ